MRKKVMVLAGLLVVLITLIVILSVQLSKPDYDEKGENTQQGEIQSDKEQIEETQKEILAGEDLMWASYNQVRNSVVKIDMGDYSGSGLIFQMTEAEIVIVSSGHLLSHYESGAVMFSNGAVGVGWVRGISDSFDVGFMVVYKEDLPEDKLGILEPVKYDMEQYERLENGAAIFQVGSTQGVAADFYMGQIQSKSWYLEEFGADMLYNFCKATPGMSGGGTFSEDGYLVGLISGSYMEESCALPLPDILDAYQELFGEGQ